MKRKKQSKLGIALQLKGSVVSSIYKQVLYLGLFGFFMSILHYFKLPVSQPVLGTIIPSIVLGLLLVFRTNTAYERFWEGRKLWGSLVNDTRNMAWQIAVMIEESNPDDRNQKAEAIRLLPIFLVACKLHLRSVPVGEELEARVTHEQFLILKKSRNPPLQIATWIGDYIQTQYKRGDNFLHFNHVPFLQGNVKRIIDSLGGCERILRTPLPLAYVIHLRQLVLIYCLLLPFPLLKDLGWGTGFFVALISFTLLGIEEIGIEIENPFGYDLNDLPLDTICNNMSNEIEEYIELNLPSQTNDQLSKLEGSQYKST